MGTCAYLRSPVLACVKILCGLLVECAVFAERNDMFNSIRKLSNMVSLFISILHREINNAKIQIFLSKLVIFNKAFFRNTNPNLRLQIRQYLPKYLNR